MLASSEVVTAKGSIPVINLQNEFNESGHINKKIKVDNEYTSSIINSPAGLIKHQAHVGCTCVFLGHCSSSFQLGMDLEYNNKYCLQTCSIMDDFGSGRFGGGPGVSQDQGPPEYHLEVWEAC